jgi:hypothetical protein
MLLDPLQHSTEGATRLAVAFDGLLFVVQARVVDTRRSRNKDLECQRCAVPSFQRTSTLPGTSTRDP